MWAIGDVLGEAVTPDAAAWDEVYWLFGCQLIAEEASFTRWAVPTPSGRGGSAGWSSVSTRRGDLLADPRARRGKDPRHHTGQYVAIAVDLPSGERQPTSVHDLVRTRGDSLRVTIKRVRGVGGAPGRPGVELVG